MALLAHPSTIPGPTAFEAEPRERRALSADETGAQQTRGRETDFNGSGVLQYEYTQAQLKIFRTWGKTELAEWSRWFSVVLPGYGGFTAHIVRFKAPPKWDHVGFSEETKGYWVVSAEVEVRGRGVAPIAEQQFSVTLDGADNAGTSSAVGVTITGLDAGGVYRVTLLNGAFSGWPNDSDNGGITWETQFYITEQGYTEGPGGAHTVTRGSGGAYRATEALAEAAFPANQTFTGLAAATFWIYDNAPSDNRGVMTLLIKGP